MSEYLQSIDWLALRWLKDCFSCSFLDYLMPKISMLGDGGFIWLAAAIALLCTKKYRLSGVMLLIGLLAGAVCGNLIMKNFFRRLRPCWLDESVEMLINIPQDFSFPSGHTLSSVIGASLLVMINRKFGFGAVPLAVLISFSRLYLFVHFPSDILSGAAFGLLIASGIFRLFTALKLSA